MNTSSLTQFSDTYKGDNIIIVEGRKAATVSVSSVTHNTVVLDHPGFTQGVHRWVFATETNGCMYGASPPGLIGQMDTFPGSDTLPGSIGLEYDGYVAVDSIWREGGFPLLRDDVISIELDMNRRSITWMKEQRGNGDGCVSFTRPLPLDDSPYVPAVGLADTSIVRIISYQQIH